MKAWDNWIKWCKKTYGAPPKAIKADVDVPHVLIPLDPPISQAQHDAIESALQAARVTAAARKKLDDRPAPKHRRHVSKAKKNRRKRRHS